MKECSYLTLNPHLIFQTFPFFGVELAILNEHGEELEGEAEGYLVSSNSIQLHTTLFIPVTAIVSSSLPLARHPDQQIHTVERKGGNNSSIRKHIQRLYAQTTCHKYINK